MPRTKGIYEKDGHFWASYTGADGRRIRRSTGIPVGRGKAGESEAEALRGKWKAEVHAEKMWGKAPEQAAPTYTFNDVLLRYLKDRVIGTKAEDDVKSASKPLYEAFNGLPMDKCDVRAFVRQRQAIEAPGTVNRRVTILSAACNYARNELGWDVPNPAARRKLPEPEGRVRWLEPEEAVRLIRAASSVMRAPWLVDYVVLSLNTGCRVGELLWLEWSRVDLRENLIYLEAQHTKSRKRRSVPLNASSRGAMLSRAGFRAEHCPDSQWVFCRKDGDRLTDIRKGFKTALRLAGIEDFRQHDQRHAAAVFMLRGGATLPEIRDVLGHSTVKMTERYAHVAPEQARATVGRIEGISRGVGHDSGTEFRTKKTGRANG